MGAFCIIKFKERKGQSGKETEKPQDQEGGFCGRGR